MVCDHLASLVATPRNQVLAQPDVVEILSKHKDASRFQPATIELLNKIFPQLNWNIDYRALRAIQMATSIEFSPASTLL
jgi:hypothetical protein